MRVHTPVVVSDDAAVAAEARRRHWPVISCQDGVLRLTGVRQTAPRPEPAMRIAEGSLDQPRAAGWKFVLDWVAKYIHSPLLVVEPHGWAEDLALWSAAARGWPVAAWTTGTTPPGETTLVRNAQGVLAFGGASHSLDPLPETPLIEVDAVTAPTPRGRDADVARVLVVAHPRTARVAAWVPELEDLADGALTVDLATAERPTTASGRVHHVPDLGAAVLASDGEALPGWASVALTHERKAAYAPTRRPGGWWQNALERWFAERDDHFDVVVLAGEPFEFFGFAAWAKRHWYARTVLDYPVAFSGAGKPPLLSHQIDGARYRERGWNLAADAVSVPDAEVAAQMVQTGPGFRVEEVADGRDLARLCLELAGRPSSA